MIETLDAKNPHSWRMGANALDGTWQLASNPTFNLFCLSVVALELQVFPKHIKWAEWWGLRSRRVRRHTCHFFVGLFFKNTRVPSVFGLYGIHLTC